MLLGRRLFLTGMLLAAASAQAQTPRFNAPKDYLLVLGDSLAFGYQRPKFLMTQDPADFTTGFADAFASRLAGTAPGRSATLINLGCPSESSTSFLAGPCLFHTVFELHVNYPGSQMNAAEAFLAAHPGQVGPVLIALGANDVFMVANACGGFNTACFMNSLPDILAALFTNTSEILLRLRAVAPDLEIIVFGLYNPFALVDPTTNNLAMAVNQVLSQAASAHRARFANAFPAFNTAQPQPQTLCSLTLVCAPDPNDADIHPSDLGYQAISDVMWEASGFARFEH